jgi:hypothetical protein
VYFRHTSFTNIGVISIIEITTGSMILISGWWRHLKPLWHKAKRRSVPPSDFDGLMGITQTIVVTIVTKTTVLHHHINVIISITRNQHTS